MGRKTQVLGCLDPLLLSHLLRRLVGFPEVRFILLRCKGVDLIAQDLCTSIVLGQFTKTRWLARLIL